ncbi:uncharacterized protein LACBIDRAFT_307978 [Laccaria bicolor S238N-H82]|uniref:Predicted protein n=1 Tax=Laccaria bicolor (strain S238N-H82 / ATCC MYA-4686) TaxID=486041 RepID=B0DRC1_LACBS|nr:uncharacterized protein LACBIDRAFT_307978 [Laccaria bicolor S238N-H82]EDR02761.1 predicted protein [Laccaria bicolor S238N-H82]|eukprot:XP_001886471.1 predicted protein [Laccaria bicolor S238N-H82]
MSVRISCVLGLPWMFLGRCKLLESSIRVGLSKSIKARSDWRNVTPTTIRRSEVVR